MRTNSIGWAGIKRENKKPRYTAPEPGRRKQLEEVEVEEEEQEEVEKESQEDEGEADHPYKYNYHEDNNL